MLGQGNGLNEGHCSESEFGRESIEQIRIAKVIPPFKKSRNLHTFVLAILISKTQLNFAFQH